MIQNKGKSAVTNILRDEDVSHDLSTKTFLCLTLEMFQYGWSANSNQGFGEAPGVKKQVLDIIRSVRTVMRIPLIFVNSLVIVKKLLMG